MEVCGRSSYSVAEMDPDPQRSAERPLRRSLRASTFDGTAHAAMVGLGESYFPAFALFLGATAFEAGMLTTVPLLVGSIFQLLTPYGAGLLGNKRWVVVSALLQALTFVPIALTLALGELAYGWLLAWVCAYWALALGINPAWNAWMGKLVPMRVRSTYFSRRNMPIQAALFVGLIGGGYALHLCAGSEVGAAYGFVALFTLAGMSRLVSTAFLRRQIERDAGATPQPVRTVTLLRRISGEPAGRVILLIVCLHASVNVAAPYFTPYMLGHLELSYAQFTLLNGTVIVARLLSSAYWGRTARRFGNRRTFQVSALLIVPLSGLWAVSDNFLYLVVLQLFAGFAWAGFELMVMLSFLDTTDEHSRARVLSIFNLLNGVAIVAGALLGGLLLEVLGPDGFVWVFLTSTVLRAAAVLLFARGAGMRRPSEHKFEDVLMRVISFRPGQGQGLRPVVVPESSGKDSTR